MTETTSATTTTATDPAGPDPQHPDRVRVEKLKMLHDYLVVRPLAVPSKLAGARLHMPDTAGEREKSHRGIVLVVGPGDWNEPGTALVPMTINPGDLVFFGKYAGTEERIGADSVIVMREQECRFCVPEGRYVLVTHDDPKLDHLIEDYCEVCHGVPMEAAAAERLALEREAQQLRLAELCACTHLGDRHAHGTGSCHDCDCTSFRPTQTSAMPEFATSPTSEVDDVNAQIRELDRKGKLELPPGELTESAYVPEVSALSDDRRPCDAPACLMMQRRCTTATGELWIGLRCGHVSAAEA